LTDYLSRPVHLQRQDKRFSRSGLAAEINRQQYPVINLSVGGMLIGNASIGFAPRQKIFFTLYRTGTPNETAFLYGYVARIDIFERVVGIDFEKPTDHAFKYLEGLRMPPRTPPGPRITAGKKSWIRRFLDSF